MAAASNPHEEKAREAKAQRLARAFPATRSEFVVLVSTRAMHPFPPCLYIELGAPLDGK